VNRQNVIAQTNDHYGIPDRQFVTNVSKAQSVSTEAALDGAVSATYTLRISGSISVA
jgi:hypothetical protein